jgi:hypothetical protein
MSYAIRTSAPPVATSSPVVLKVAAKAVKLRYVSNHTQDIRRERTAQEFGYRNPDGSKKWPSPRFSVANSPAPGYSAASGPCLNLV